MSYSKEKESLQIKTIKVKKNCKFIDEITIQYNRELEEIEFEAQMKNGYIEMGKINLDIAQEFEELADVEEYETWLCGV